MGIISVIVRTHDGVETWGAWDDLEEAKLYAIDASANGRDVEWAKVVEAMDGDPVAGSNAVFSYCEQGGAINPIEG